MANANFKILIRGYVKKIKGGIAASPNTLLIRYNGINIIAGPGANKRKLLNALSRENLKPSDIDFVFVSHYHLDHTMNTALFTNADVIDSTTIYSKDREVPHSGLIPGTKIRIVAAPGHADEHAVLVIPTNKGTVVFASDVFWWKDWENQKVEVKKKDEYAADFKALVTSRKQVLRMGDYIIPGHGRMFKVRR